MTARGALPEGRKACRCAGRSPEGAPRGEARARKERFREGEGQRGRASRRGHGTDTASSRGRRAGTRNARSVGRDGMGSGDGLHLSEGAPGRGAVNWQACGAPSGRRAGVRGRRPGRMDGTAGRDPNGARHGTAPRPTGRHGRTLPRQPEGTAAQRHSRRHGRTARPVGRQGRAPAGRKARRTQPRRPEGTAGRRPARWHGQDSGPARGTAEQRSGRSEGARKVRRTRLRRTEGEAGRGRAGQATAPRGRSAEAGQLDGVAGRLAGWVSGGER